MRKCRESVGGVLLLVQGDTVERVGWGDRFATEAVVRPPRSSANVARLRATCLGPVRA